MCKHLAALFVFLCWAGPARAQVATPVAPAGAPPVASAPEVRLATTAFGAYSDLDISGPVPVVQDGLESGGNASLRARWRSGRIGLNGIVSSSMRNLDMQERGRFWSHLAHARFDTAPTLRTTLSFEAGGGYSQFAPFASGPRPEGVDGQLVEQLHASDFGVAGRDTANFNAAAQFGRELTTRSSLTFRADARRTRGKSGPRIATDEFGGQVDLVNRFRRRAALQLGYGFSQAEYTPAAVAARVLRQHTVNVAFDRDWAHSPTRQTVLHLGVGPSALLDASGSQYIAVGDASIMTQMGRMWSFSAGIARDMGFLDGVARPFVSESANAQLQTRLGAGVDLLLVGVASRGKTPLAVAADGGSYESLGGTARLTWLVARTFSVYCELMTTQYVLSGNIATAGLATRNDRRSLRAGVAWDLGLKGQRSPNAPR